MTAVSLSGRPDFSLTEDDVPAPFEPRSLNTPMDRIRDRGTTFLTRAAAA